MFTDVLKTFAKLSVVVVLFIIAFSLGFHCLLADQVHKLAISYTDLQKQLNMVL